MEDAPWVRTKDSTEGLLGQWHMPAGEGADGSLLTACDISFSSQDHLEERIVRLVPSNERCPVCQAVYAVRQQNPG